jgi:hypothetical protein
MKIDEIESNTRIAFPLDRSAEQHTSRNFGESDVFQKEFPPPWRA